MINGAGFIDSDVSEWVLWASVVSHGRKYQFANCFILFTICTCGGLVCLLCKTFLKNIIELREP